MHIHSLVILDIDIYIYIYNIYIIYIYICIDKWGAKELPRVSQLHESGRLIVPVQNPQIFTPSPGHPFSSALTDVDHFRGGTVK